MVVVETPPRFTLPAIPHRSKLPEMLESRGGGRSIFEQSCNSTGILD